ncbi:T9SS-dependent M36 family metallopeptidase [Sanyastnella coralliicola]|uniref:T9SS-dependent M36 family metallopeptidase n=1 Tax=Sanyastnella coralliicola TaxID=3069118 RepID=UPI0027BB0F92|nr:T9SS-dependent M36 family metallopeptidase [Longitalea sp. SCSIO 12813]
MRFKLTVVLAALLVSVGMLAQNSEGKIKDEILRNGSKERLTEQDIRSSVLLRSIENKVGYTYHYMQQHVDGIPVHNAIMNVVLTPEGVLRSVNDTYVAGIDRSIGVRAPGMTPEAALNAAANHLKAGTASPSIVESPQGAEQKGKFTAAGVSLEEIPFQLVYTPIENGQVILSWEFVIRTLDHQHWWQIRVNASNGDFLSKNDWITTCGFGDEVHSHNAECAKVEGRNPLLTPASPALPLANSYRVYEEPKESPYDGDRTLVASPWNANLTASPFGWHDTDGASGAEFTITRGNNVWAQEDRNGDNGTGFSPDGGASLDFDYALDLTQAPVTYQEAAITNLFYWNNLAHDVLYNYGFDEASGNFQVNNYGNPGLGNDEVLADAQDGSGVNNANFGTPPDGQQPRMQMFEWDVAPAPTFTANGTAYNAITAAFGAQTGSWSGELALADDGTGAPTEACSALINGGDVSGKFALIDRGSCNFTQKVLNAQNAGAIGVVVVQNTGDAPFSMGGADATITIPAVMVSLADGNAIKAALTSGTVNIVLDLPSAVNRDSDLDNGVIAHEYGHGVSNRLTAGGDIVSCLFNTEQMGEGWSDYLALILTMKPGDAGTDARAIGNYSLGDGPAGPGIRPFPYSTDLGVNPMTYNTINSVSVPHGVGSVWCTMLWDMTWLLIDQYGWDPDLYNGTGGNNIALQLVLEGMKLQPCSPGFVDGRDAILLADQMLYGGANECLIWEAFARRGLGAGADQGSSGSVADGVESYDLGGACVLNISKTSAETMEAGSNMVVTVEVTNNTDADVTNVQITDVIPAEVNYVGGSASCTANFSAGTLTLDLGTMVPGQTIVCTYEVSAPASPFSIINFQDDLESGTAAYTTSEVGIYSWALSSNRVNSGANAWFASNPGEESDQYLVLPSVSGITAQTFLSFWHLYNTELNWDGCVLEISTDGGVNFTDAGGLITQNGYNGTINTNPQSAISGQSAWTGGSGNFIQTIVDLSSFAGQTIDIRWRFASDQFVAAEGWYVDDIFIGDALIDFTNTACVSSTETSTYCDSQYTMILENVAGVEGCTDPTACNYDPAANQDDGSCESLSCAGCTDPTACNYDPTATIDDGGCLTFDECGNCGGTDTSGCTDAGACNYDPAADCDDGSCEFLSCAGCTDPTACNYDATATIDDGGCLALDECGNCGGTDTSGCTDAGACNYDPAADCDDGSCEFLTCAGCTDPAACNYDATATIDDGSCLAFDECGNCGGTDTTGCTDPLACNYDVDADCDDGSCEFATCQGCTDPIACNYDPTATIDDASCLLPTTWYADNDNDNFGDPDNSLEACTQPAGYVADNTDCNDNNNAMYPGAPGTGEDIDNNCDGSIEGAEAAPCLGDFNDDGLINVADLLIFLADFGCTENCIADMNGDNAVNAGDMLIFLGVFDSECP